MNSSSQEPALINGGDGALPVPSQLGPLTFEDLRLRVGRATGADHALDAHIMCWLHGYTMHERSDPTKGIFAFWDHGICHNSTSWASPTSDIEWMLAAARARFADQAIVLRDTPGALSQASIGSHNIGHRTLSLALLAAFMDLTGRDGMGRAPCPPVVEEDGPGMNKATQ